MPVTPPSALQPATFSKAPSMQPKYWTQGVFEIIQSFKSYFAKQTQLYFPAPNSFKSTNPLYLYLGSFGTSISLFFSCTSSITTSFQKFIPYNFRNFSYASQSSSTDFRFQVSFSPYLVFSTYIGFSVYTGFSTYIGSSTYIGFSTCICFSTTMDLNFSPYFSSPLLYFSSSTDFSMTIEGLSFSRKFNLFSDQLLDCIQVVLQLTGLKVVQVGLQDLVKFVKLGEFVTIGQFYQSFIADVQLYEFAKLEETG